MFDEGPDFTITFADQGDDVDTCRAGPRHRSQQCAFPDAAAAKDADALTFPAGEQSVDNANPRGEGLVDMNAIHRARRLCIEGPGLRCKDRNAAVDRHSETIEHSAKQMLGYFHVAVSSTCNDAITKAEALGLFERHRQHTPFPETYYLGANVPATASPDLAKIPHGGSGSARLYDQADQFDDFTFHAQGLNPVQGGGITAEVDSAWSTHRFISRCRFARWQGGRPGRG